MIRMHRHIRIWAGCLALATWLSSPCGGAHAGLWGDDFNDGNLEGWTKTHGPGNWLVKDGILNVTITPPFPEASPTCLLELTAFPVDEKRLRVRCAVLDVFAGPFVGILLGRPSGDGGAPFATSYKFYIGQIDGPTVLPAKSPRITYKVHHLDIRFDKGHFQLFTELGLLADFEDDVLQTIQVVGIVAKGDEFFHAVLDDFVISGPGIPDRRPFAVQVQGKVAVAWGKLKRS